MSEFDTYKEDYSSEINKAISFVGQSHDYFTKVKARYLSAIIDGEAKQGPVNILDVGCGHGLIHPFLKGMTKDKFELTGIDVAGEVIDIAKKTNPEFSYQAFDGKTIPYPDESFSVIFTICVMHHVPPAEWETFLAEIRKKLKPGGTFVVFEHNPLNPLTLWTVKTCPIDKDAVLLTSGKLQSLVKKSSMKVEENRFILFTPVDKPAFARLDENLGWLPVGAQYYVKARK